MKKDISSNGQASVKAMAGPGPSDKSTTGAITLAISGRLDSHSTGRIWREASALLDKKQSDSLIIDASGISYCDGAGVGLLFHLRENTMQAKGKVEIQGLKEEFLNLLNIFDPNEFKIFFEKKQPKTNFISGLGLSAVNLWLNIKSLIIFTGELLSALAFTAFHPSHIRWKDAFYTMETAGVNALPIIGLVSFLIGLVMAFQSAIPMRMFGAEMFVANLIAISMLRELGPLMTAIILAGRSGSAFAAELGTMKVNEEIDALTTMGLDPVKFLVVTRVTAGVIVTPLLTVFADLFGLIGGGVVMLSMGFPLVTYVDRVISSVDYIGLLGGLIKSVVFGVLVAGIGCLSGLQTGTGASAVGESATKAVVHGIILIIITDGIFSVIYYYLGI